MKIEKSILEMIFEFAEKTPDKAAYIIDDVVITYAELKKYILAAAKVLTSKGMDGKKKIVSIAGARLEFIVNMFATYLIGSVWVPLESTMKKDGVDDVFAQVEADYALVPFEAEEANYIDRDSLFAEVVEAYEKGDLLEEYTMPDLEEVSDILFTTGTTGKSKGIELRHRNMMATTINTYTKMGLTDKDINLVPAPLNHAFGIRRVYAMNVIGATVILLDGVRVPRKFFDAIEKYKPTAITMVASAFEFILKLSKGKIGEYKDIIKCINVGAQPVSEGLKQSLRELLPNTNLINIYGSTEAGCVTGMSFSEHWEKRASIGTPSVCAEILFSDAEGNLIENPTKENPGFITVGGDTVMKGYLNEPELNAKTIVNGRVLTSDMAYVDEDGFIYTLGRKGDVINVGGNKVSPAEVEETLMKMPGIKECACIGIDDPKGILGKVPKMFVVYEKDEVPVDEMKRFLREKLEQYKVPAFFEEIDEIPRTFNGKIQHYKLVELENSRKN